MYLREGCFTALGIEREGEIEASRFIVKVECFEALPELKLSIGFKNTKYDFFFSFTIESYSDSAIHFSLFYKLLNLYVNIHIKKFIII